MKNHKAKIIGAGLLFSCSALGQGFQFDNLDQSDVDDIMNDLSGSMVHTSVAGAGPLAATIGVEFGVVAGMAKTPNLNRLVQDSGSDEEVSELPHGGLLARVGVTSNFNFELLYFPKLDLDDTSFQSTSFAAQYNFLSVGLFHFALKGHMTNTAISYSQVADGSNVDVAIENKITGAQLLASANLGLLEPYIGVGYLSSDGVMDVSGDATIFDQNYSSKSSMDSELNSTHFLGGVELDIGFFNLGVESSHSYGNSRYSLKASFEF